ncbi:hypothetical protein ACFX13_005253 [Malus domestica]|uniref:CRIB domain-containing protein RIC10-like n=1 Tax=Malus domestica TaxID=3750 RepID=UPI0010AA9E50|nr:CRIB domain-containing protein RIC10-like [Malus domestica]XP_028943412.1 CRIB domain-containing protein RIC10-like [Malus domestica]XP_050107108.1 CRIB domain-containing protein RIC10-like [Malus sylvestris]XP_050107109.1 CRIB domain-containing protein RIC10-like [Malus sylvestris]
MAKILKYFSQMFVVKEREMKIGLPTDVKHVAHIGWDGPSESAPSWMNEFKNGPDFSTSSLGRNASDRMGSTNPMAYSPWSSQDFDQSITQQPSSGPCRDLPPTELPNVPKKPKRKKVKSSSSSGGRSSRGSK